MAATIALGSLLAVTFAGCGEERVNSTIATTTTQPSVTTSTTATPTSIPDTTTPAGADDLVLRIETTGGFVPPGFLVTEIAEFSLFGDGRVITVGPQIEIFPPPALANLLFTQLTDSELRTVLQAAADAGLAGDDIHFDYPLVADAPTTYFTLVTDGVTHSVSAYALGFESAGQLDPAPAAARQRLARFRARALDIAGQIGSSQPYGFERVAVYGEVADAGEPPDVRDWPLDDLGNALADTGLGVFRCAVFSGEDLRVLLPELERASTATTWQSEGLTYVVYLRPLLPDEAGCRTGF